jgi:hypothetical protein
LIYRGKELPISILFIAWKKYMGNIFVGNIILVYLWGPSFPIELWLVGLPYYGVVLVAVLAISIALGVALLPILRQTRVQTFADFWRLPQIDDLDENEPVEADEK